MENDGYTKVTMRILSGTLVKVKTINAIYGGTIGDTLDKAVDALIETLPQDVRKTVKNAATHAAQSKK